MKRAFVILVAVIAPLLASSIARAQSARQLTRRIVTPANDPRAANRASASKPAPTPPAPAPANTNTAVPAPPPPADPEKAKLEALKKTIEFQKKRAAEGSPSAQYELGLRYLNGDGLEKDDDAGMKLLEESAKQDYTLAKRKLDELKEKKKK
jgi:TPR repeat protein